MGIQVANAQLAFLPFKKKKKTNHCLRKEFENDYETMRSSLSCGTLKQKKLLARCENSYPIN